MYLFNSGDVISNAKETIGDIVKLTTIPLGALVTDKNDLPILLARVENKITKSLATKQNS